MITDAQGRTSNITFTDLNASNGVIHRIDRVLLPTLNIVQQAQITPSLSILVEAVVAANLAGALSDPDATFTVFAPTNDAFAALLVELGTSKADLLANTGLLTTVLTYHVLTSEVRSTDLVGVGTTTVNSLESSPVTIIETPLSIDDEATGRSNANIVLPDVACSNGVVHVIDKVILPNLGPT